MRKPIRAVGIVIKEDTVLLMWREQDGKQFYVFPGGAREEGETIEQAVKRELKEETSIEVAVGRLLYHIHYLDESSDSDQYFFLCSYVSGEPNLGNFNEMRDMKAKRRFYKPLWVDVSKISKMLVYPLEVRDWFLKDIPTGFKNVPRERTMKVSEIRQSL